MTTCAVTLDVERTRENTRGHEVEYLAAERTCRAAQPREQGSYLPTAVYETTRRPRNGAHLHVVEVSASEVERETCFCHGCGSTIVVAESAWHNGDHYCDDCESAPADATDADGEAVSS